MSLHNWWDTFETHQHVRKPQPRATVLHRSVRFRPWQRRTCADQERTAGRANCPHVRPSEPGVFCSIAWSKNGCKMVAFRSGSLYSPYKRGHCQEMPEFRADRNWVTSVFDHPHLVPMMPVVPCLRLELPQVFSPPNVADKFKTILHRTTTLQLLFMPSAHNLDCAALSNYPTIRVIYKAESVNSEEGSYRRWFGKILEKYKSAIYG